MSKKQLIGILILSCLISSYGFAETYVDTKGPKVKAPIGAESETGKIPEYSKADNPIEANIGTDFIITLESNRTTGYEWQLAKPLDKTIVDFVSSEYIKGSSDLIGSGGREMWRFKTVGLGKSTISFQYIRPLEKDTPPAANKDFIVIVKKDTGK